MRPAVWGPAGLVLCALTLGVFVTRCDLGAVWGPPLVAGYAAGAMLLAAAAIGRLRPGVAGAIAVVLLVGLLAAAAAYVGFLVTFARCFEY